MKPNIHPETYRTVLFFDSSANEARDVAIDVAISNSFGFGGTNGTLVFKKFEG